MTAPWTATVVTIFPEMFPGPLGASLAGRALQRDLWRLDPVDLRGFAADRHQTVDDTPFGGGAGMVMRPDIVARAVDAVVERGAPGRWSISARAASPCARRAWPSSRPARAWCCCAGATRASTTG